MDSSVLSAAVSQPSELDRERTDAGPAPDRTCSDDKRDLDRLFPDPETRQLLHEVAGDLREVERFVSRMNSELQAELKSEPERKRSVKSFSLR